MANKYYYGLEDEEIYSHKDLYDCVDELSFIEEDQEYLIIIELKVSAKAGRQCGLDADYFDPDCGKYNCNDYISRNGKNGICKHLTYALLETGAKWKLFKNEHFEKISKRTNKC